MAATSDFNYKVALASGLRELQAGRLRQAEQQFAYLCDKFPDAPGGYRGVAKVRMERGDRPGALAGLRDGAARMAKAGAHAGVVALLREALQLDPVDLASHRRLAAAHALAGEADAAAEEYVRYVHATAAIDPAAAQRETRYGIDSLGSLPGLVALAREVGLDTGAPVAPFDARREPPAPADSRQEAPTDAPTGAIPGVPRRERSEPEAPSIDPRLSLLGLGGAAAPDASAPAAAEGGTAAPEVALRQPAPEPELDATDDPLAADERAAEYIAKGDPRAAQAALIAARHFIADGRTNAASDLLLQLIASGRADHQAQRLLVEVVSSIGKRDVARAKCALLAEALRLDGQAELAVEVERLAQAV